MITTEVHSSDLFMKGGIVCLHAHIHTDKQKVAVALQEAVAGWFAELRMDLVADGLAAPYANETIAPTPDFNAGMLAACLIRWAKEQGDVRTSVRYTREAETVLRAITALGFKVVKAGGKTRMRATAGRP